MTQEEAIKYLQQLYLNGGHCWLDEQRIEAISMAIKALQEEPVSNDLEEAADKHLVEKGYLLTTNNGEHLAEVEAKGLFKAGAQWQKEQMGKKVDLEKEVHNAADQYDINNNGNIYWEDIVGFAKHFFELGLKAQKGG